MADSLFNNVSLLLPLDGPAGATTFRDYSANHHVVTTAGNTVAKAVGKYNGSSAYFDGTGDWLTTPNTSLFDFSGTGDFCIEGWVNIGSLSAVRGIFGARANGVATGWCLYVNASGLLFTGSKRNGGTYADTQIHTTVMTVGVWYHIAWVKYGSSLTAYINGVAGTPLTGLTTGGLDYQAAQPVIVGALGSGGELPYVGYLSDLRITKGAARYTTDFTPPTGPLRHALDPTVVLRLPFDDLFDYSQTGAAITASGNAAVSATQSKFGGKALALDGTGDWLTLPATALSLGTGDFTIEMWIYPTALPAAYQGLVDFRNSGSTTHALFTLNGSGLIFWMASSSRITGGTVVTNTWQHVAVCRYAGTTKMFLGGVQVGSSYTDANTYAVATSLYIGSTFDAFAFNGYIDDLTITRRAKYTTTFTPPTAPLATETTVDEYLSSVVLQLQMDGANASTTITDSSPTPKTVTAVGGAQISTAQSRFGGSSAYFDGSGDYLSLASEASFDLSTGDYTVEGWFYYSGTSNAYPLFVGCATAWAAGSVSIAIDHAWGANKVIVTAYSHATGAATVSTTTTISYGTWHHLAVCRSGTSLKIFYDGVLEGTATISASLAFDFGYGGLRIAGGNGDGANSYFNGYIDDLRITKGVARYV